MWLRYGVYILLAYNAYALVSSDEETAAWTLSSLHTEPKKIDLTPTHVEKSISCMSDENSGYCVPYYQCDSNNFIREDGSTLINIRKPKRLCPLTSQVCCLLQVRTNELEDNHTNSVDMQTTFSSVDLEPKKIDLTPTHVEKSISCMSDENSGYCVPYYQCDSNNLIREDGSTLLNIRKPKRLCPLTSQVCCLLQVRTNELEDNHTNSVDMQTTFSSVDLGCVTGSNESGVCVKQSQCRVDPATKFTIRSSDGSPLQDSNQCPWTQVCCSVGNVISQNNSQIAIPLGCGYSNPGASYTSGSTVRSIPAKASYAEYAEFPWMVALMVKKNIPSKGFEDEYIGGGTLIHPSVVLTVAHKVYEAQSEQLKCRAGEWDWSIKDELYTHQERDVTKIIVNENFHQTYIYYDVALLVLSSPFNLANAPHIGLGCLAPVLPAPDSLCYSMGWGKDLTKHANITNVLKKIKLPLVEDSVCENSIKNTRVGKVYKLHKSFICAGGEVGVDTCQGDGGSPLVCRIKDTNGMRYSVVGMVSYGVDCGSQNVPGVYAKVPEFYNWVIEKIERILVEIK